MKGERLMKRKRTVLAISAVLVLVIVGAVLLAAAPISAATPGKEFVETVWAFEEAFQGGDVNEIIEFYAEDAISLPPGYPASVGQDTIRADLEWFFSEFDLEREFALADYEVVGNYGTRLGEWTQTLTPKAGGDPIVEVGRCILGWEKIQGEWKVVWEIWNTY
jgi:ketosteroid isomerase-like protein